jgi:AcrR family transcriptional regulator
LAVALDQFWAQGFEQTSISCLTREMKIGAPSLYAAFGDKQQLFDEAAAQYVGRFRARVEECLAIEDPFDAVSALLRETAIANTNDASPPGCFVLHEPRLAAERAVLRDALVGKLRAGGHDHDAATDLARYIEAIMVGMSEQSRDGAGIDELEAVCRVALEALRGSLRAGTQPS